MARETGRLKDKRVTTLIRAGLPGSHYDGRGLTLKIKASGNAAWESRYQIDGVTRYYGLGSAADFTLVEARERNRRLVRQPLADGRDPLAAKRAERAAQVAAAAKAMTFAEACDEFLTQRRSSWTSDKHAKQWASTLETYAKPILGALPVAAIDVPLILKVLEQPVAASTGYPAGRLWDTRPETGARLRGRLEAVLDWCKARQLRSGDNPADFDVIEKVLPLRKSTKHHEAMPFKDIPAFMIELRAREGSAARALEFLILTAARSQEVIGAKWSEIDLDEGVWTVPASRMKMDREHRVPLSDDVLALLRGLYREGVPNGTGDTNVSADGYVFIGAQQGRPLGHTTLARTLEHMGQKVTVHGFRASCRTWASERTNYAHDVREAVLAHTKGKLGDAYNHGDLFDKRRRLMRDWSRYCSTPPTAKGAKGNIHQLHPAAK